MRETSRFGALGFAAALAFAAGAALAGPPADAVPAPDFERVRYAKPDGYTALLPTMGKRDVIEKTAASIRGDTFEQRLALVRAWVEKNLRYDEHAAYAWRPFDKMLADGTYGGCADHALAFGCLTRALGIPTVWVKTMDAAWIREFVSVGEERMNGWRGHVFLEVFDGKKWVLLNATQGVLHEDYDVRSRILPGSRYAYDKGGDPYALVLSPRWEEWKQQTRATFKGFDLSRLPVAGGRSLAEDPTETVFVAANEPGWGRIVERAHTLGRPTGRSGNGEFELWIPRARGRRGVVASVGGNEVLPEPYRSRLLPKPFAALAAEAGRGPSWTLPRTLDDGTRVVLVYGKDEEALAAAIASLTFDAK